MCYSKTSKSPTKSHASEILMLSVMCIHEKPLNNPPPPREYSHGELRLFVCTLRLDRPSNGKLFGDYRCILESYCLVCTMPFFSTIVENMPVGRFHNNTSCQSYLFVLFYCEAFYFTEVRCFQI